MATAWWPLQVSVISTLKADTALAALAKVYDVPPADAPLPYVALGSVRETADDVHNQRGISTTLVLHIWSDYAGRKEAADILAAVAAVLDRKPLTVPGWPNVSVALTDADDIPDPDPRIRHINASFRVWLSQ